MIKDTHGLCVLSLNLKEAAALQFRYKALLTCHSGANTKPEAGRTLVVWQFLQEPTGTKRGEKPHFLIHFQKRKKKNSDVKSKPLFQYYYRCRKILGKYQGLKSGERV